MDEHLLLKWGSLKAWNVESDASVAALKKWADGGVNMSAAMQKDSGDQKAALCELIDAVDGEIWNDWSGEQMTKDEAKKYVMEYGQ